MRLLLTDYVASLKERGELDAILPDMLSELNFNVISKPAIGVVQHGVDIAAVGNDQHGERKLFLLTVKAGDLGRADWANGDQALRPSLDQIRETYIRHRIPPEHKKLKVVIVIVIGGVIHQGVQQDVSGYIESYESKKLSFETWNGDQIAALLEKGLLREKLLPAALRSSLQKAVAMVDQPDVSYDHFARLVFALRKQASTEKERASAARQIYVCLWVLFVWGREIDNLDAPYKASELALLHVWELVKTIIGKRGPHASAIVRVFHHLTLLHTTISGIILEQKIFPYIDKKHALSAAVLTGEPTDVSLKMFETLGRLALTGYWMMWMGQFGGKALNDVQIEGLKQHARRGMRLIANNPALYSPLMDEHAIDIALFLGFAAQVGNVNNDIRNWVAEIARRISIATNTHGRYPAALRDYTDLINHPKAQTNEYREEVTPGSVLIPLLLAWAAAVGDDKSADKLVDLKAGALSHCTLQLWLPDEESEKHLYVNDALHGAVLTDLPITNRGQDLLKVLVEACKTYVQLNDLTAIRTGYSAVVLTACRHYRLPIPPQFWIAYLVPPEDLDIGDGAPPPQALPTTRQRRARKMSKRPAERQKRRRKSVEPAVRR
jgi:hypothetical protein